MRRAIAALSCSASWRPNSPRMVHHARQSPARGHAEPHQVAHLSQAVVPDRDTTCADAGHPPAPLTRPGADRVSGARRPAPAPAAGHADPVVPPHIHAEPPGSGDIVRRSGHEQDSSGRKRERVESPAGTARAAACTLRRSARSQNTYRSCLLQVGSAFISDAVLEVIFAESFQSACSFRRGSMGCIRAPLMGSVPMKRHVSPARFRRLEVSMAAVVFFPAVGPRGGTCPGSSGVKAWRLIQPVSGGMRTVGFRRML
jgi:hypothetical protein